jgi:hypothetical protein
MANAVSLILNRSFRRQVGFKAATYSSNSCFRRRVAASHPADFHRFAALSPNSASLYAADLMWAGH